jgi:RNA polymerase-binding transcription factor
VKATAKAPTQDLKQSAGKVGSLKPPADAKASATTSSRNSVTATKDSKTATATQTKDAPAKGVKARAVAPATPPDGVTMQDGRYALPATTRIDLPANYKPSSDNEEYMGPRHLEYFRRKLQKWREDLVEESKQTIENLRDEVRDVGDEAERATRETENSLELRTRDRYRKLISKIDKALKRIEEGRYGYCEETDEEIGLDRLEARPIATLSLDAQERWEHRQRQMGD